MSDELFRGIAGASGGPTILDLGTLVPNKFRSLNNPWRVFAAKLRHKGMQCDRGLWKFKDTDQEEIRHQLACLFAVMAISKRASTPDELMRCDSIAACMLSEMLEEVPQYVPA